MLGHEFTHAVTQFTANLTYQGQSGALNESVSDCFGMCVKQRVLGQTAETADWLVGEGIFLPGINARALRDMAHPGTAYDDPTLGKDPQVGVMATTSRPPTTTAASTPTPASPTVPSSSRPPRSAATPGRAPARSGTTR